MPVLKLDRIADRRLRKLDKRYHNMISRFEKTKKAFDENHLDPRLDFKRQQSTKTSWKIRLLGKNDGMRLMLTPSSDSNTYYVSDVIDHDKIKLSK